MRAKAPFRLTPATLDVLSVLSDGNKRYGHELAHIVDRPSGSIVTILSRLEEHGWAESKWEVSNRPGPRRRFFWIMPERLAEVQKILAERRPLPERKGKESYASD